MYVGRLGGWIGLGGLRLVQKQISCEDDRREANASALNAGDAEVSRGARWRTASDWPDVLIVLDLGRRGR